jgi:hypothetical protein
MANNIRAWCASHIDSKYKPVLINQMLESLLINNITNCEISISFKQTYTDEEINYIINGINNFIKKLKTRFSIFKITTHYNVIDELSQFEHLNILYKNFSGKGNDKIMFIDDDDILLKLPEEYLTNDIVKGIQYIPINTSAEDLTYKKNVNEILETSEIFSSRWTIDTDFSGYMCRYQDLVEYFTMIRLNRLKQFNTNVPDRVKLQQIITAINSLEDIEFMNYLDDSGAIKTQQPFIFRRLWQAEDREIPTWKSKLQDAKSKFVQMSGII